MKKLPVDKGQAYLITDRLTREYFCGVDIAEGWLLIGQNLTLFTDARYFYSAKQLCESVNVDCKLYKDNCDLSSFLQSNGVETLFIDFEKSTVKEYFDYLEFGLEVKNGCNELQLFKSIKDETELESIKSACEIVQKAYHQAIKTVKVGMTEIELKETIESLMISYGAKEPSFDTIVAFGENSAVPHHDTGFTKLKENSVILVDVGCKVNGYCSDLTRTAFFGTPDKKFLDCYDAVLNANILAEQNITDKMSAIDADALARNYLKEKSLDKFFTHSLGHGVGQEIHEYPRLSPKSDATMKNGMVFTVEPGVYFDGQFGIRIEDTVLLKYGKVERLFTDSKQLLILKP